MRAGAVIAYVAVMVGVVLMADAGIDKACLVWEAASLSVGWISRCQWSVLLPFLAIPVAVPRRSDSLWRAVSPRSQTGLKQAISSLLRQRLGEVGPGATGNYPDPKGQQIEAVRATQQS